MSPVLTKDGHVYRFGPFEANVRSGELRKNGIRIRIREQPFQILLLLLERPGEVVLRDEIRDRLWPGDLIVDFDHGINTAVQRLRHALNESAAQPKYVETVGRRGYRFLALVQHVTAEPVAEMPSTAGSWWWALVAAGTLVAVMIVWLMHRTPTRADIAIPLTTLPGLALSPSFSPDGAKVAFSWNGYQGDNSDIYVKQIGSNAVLRLTNDRAVDESPVWSPDDRYIAFIRRLRNGIRAVMLIPPFGGPERKVTEISAPPAPTPVGAQAPLSWTPDSKWLAVAFRGSSEEPGSIWLISIDSGERRRLTAPPRQDEDDSNPSISADGTMLAFSRGNSMQYVNHAYVVPLSRNWRPAAEPRLLSRMPSALISGIAWASKNEIVFSAGAGATPRLWRVGLSGVTPAVRLTVPEDALRPGISVAARRLVYASLVSDGDIWQLDARTGSRKPLIAARGVQAFPRYSPDGRRIAFMSTRSGDQEIWTCAADGSNCTPVTSFGGPQTGAPNWSPDGRSLVFDTRPAEKGQIFMVSSDGGRPRQISSGEFDDVTPSWSRDGHWIYFASSRTGTYEIWKMPSQGGSAVQITSSGGAWPNESADGRFLYYGKMGRRGLFRLPIEGGTETLVQAAVENGNSWGLTADGFYFVARRNEPQTPGVGLRRPFAFWLWFQAFGRDEARVIAELDPDSRLGFCVSPDGAFILGSRWRTRADLMLVGNFH